jgi:hypothetical protein
MMYKAFVAAALSPLVGSVAAAQTVYEPVASQYRVGDQTFYYGGSDPRAIEYAARQVVGFDPAGRNTREGRFGVGYLRRGLIGRPPEYVVADGLPLRNAVVYGYTSVDARNDAYANVPRFFRTADLAAAAVPSPDGVGVVVPAQAAVAVRAIGAVVVRPAARPAAPPATGPATQPTPILIIPKDLLRPRAAPGDLVTAAR